MSGQPVAVVYRDLRLPDTERALLITSLIMIGSGVILVLSINIISYLRAKRSKSRAVVERDAQIATPRCHTKAEELGLSRVKHWKNYFSRPEPFVPDN